MALLTPLSLTSMEEFVAVQQATARKLIDVAVAQTGTSPDDWVVRNTMPAGSGTGPASGPANTATPDFQVSSAWDVQTTQGGWDLSVDGLTQPSTAWVAANSGNTTVSDQQFHGVFGWWEDAKHEGVADQEANGGAQQPMTQGWRFVSGASTLDIFWGEGQHISSEAVGGITKTPVIFTQNSNMSLEIWLNEPQKDGSAVTGHHACGLFMLTCERVGETISTPGIHTTVPMGIVTGSAFQARQSEVARNLLNLASSKTGTPVSDWIVRPMILDDNDANAPLSNMDLTGDGDVYGGGTIAGAGWHADSGQIGHAAWETVLTDTTVPDQKFMACFGGFESPVAGNAAAGNAVSGNIACWALQSGSQTSSFMYVGDQYAWANQWGFLMNKAVYWEQNSTINFKVVGKASSKQFFDSTTGLYVLVAEKVGENISATKISRA